MSALVGVMLPGLLRAADTPREDPAAWWSVQPVIRPAVPSEGASAQPGDPIDAFVAVKLREKGLAFSAEADRRTLIRRLSFDLLGLPPSPEEVKTFVEDQRMDAYERLVDRLLASPHYGERWAQHWLDIAHYADTHGFERDQRRDNAWRYRDYVIDSLNADKPYDQFLREQVAGDVLASDKPAAVIATGFLAAGPWDFVGQVETKSDMLRRAARAGDLDDMVTQVITATVGMTINCARCHDHKLDPISQREYYGLWSVFAGVRRGEREVNAGESQAHAAQLAVWNRERAEVDREIGRLAGNPLDLADIVGGGNGYGTGKAGEGIDPRSGHPQGKKLGYLENAVANQFVRGSSSFVDGVLIPNGSADGHVAVPISSTGLEVTDVPSTSAKAWDAIRNGPVNAQASTKLGDVDFATNGHTLLGLHANAGITFDLEAIRKESGRGKMRFRATVGYGGHNEAGRADFHVYVDGVLRERRLGLNDRAAGVPVDVDLPVTAHFLTLMSTDGGNGIGNDQIFFGDPKLAPEEPPHLAEENRGELDRLKARRTELDQQIKSLPSPAKVYAIRSETPEVVHVLKRGNPETPEDAVVPGAIKWATLPMSFGGQEMPDGERRVALANWITDPRNPLTRRVIVNRLWHYHFGQGIVSTPSDFGHGGDRPSHPELLDWLADELLARNWSLKAMQRLIVTSRTYRQSSQFDARAAALDAQNRLLWRANPQRLDAESLHDTVLAVSGTLNESMGGPGFRDFDYTEAYAPIYRYITADRPELCRRSIYRFVVRTTPQQFLTTLDCPNPANLTPVRVNTTTALQALALLNNEFMLKQAGHFAERVKREAGPDPSARARRAFELAFLRPATDTESVSAEKFCAGHGLAALCRLLLNANEFVYLD
ncbi:MAG: DUF1553 domain-containing protein [Chthoniobacter sp.]|uniref:DUF1553 domain-containing protein n=1 Tax=Chthoniobacter sp. TaxID=2510640 RepID=UPI0032AA2E5F